MSSLEDNDNGLEEAGIIVPDDLETSDSMHTLAHTILDDVLYNIIHDIVLKTHRDEKIARANTAAIIIEQEAAKSYSSQADPDTPSKTGNSKLPQRIENDGAIYEDGIVYIKGNPLTTTHEIRCSKCGLPRLLHPTDGNGARKPEEGKKYCKQHPFIDKPGHDIYGIPFPKDDVSNKKSKPKLVTSLLANSSQPDNIDSSFESPAPSPPPETKPKAASVFPNVECPKCDRSVNIRVFARHLNSHMKGGGRASGRAAIMKITGAQNGTTPPGSRKGTPAINMKSSPQKRFAEGFDEDDEDDEEDDDDGAESSSPKKKRRKKLVEIKVKPKPRLKLKNEGVTKKWKSGKVTVDGKTVEKPGILEKKAVKTRENSESSQTLSSP